MIHVCFGLHDKTGHYSKFTGTAMLSLFENCNSLRSITVHILHDNTLTRDNREKFIYLAGRYGQIVKFYNVEELCADKIAEFWKLIPAIKTSWSTIGTFFKFLIPKIVPSDIDKCIYLDSDMIVNLDIAELWRVELDDKPLAAIPEMEANAYDYKYYAKEKYLLIGNFVTYGDYFNAGLLVMNLNYLRNAESVIMNGIEWRGEHTQCNCFDQDIWNYLYSKNYVALPVKFDRFVSNECSQGRTQIEQAIYHYSSGIGLGFQMNDPFNRLWMNYFMKTPWFNADSIGKLYNALRQQHVEFVRQQHVEFKSAMVQLSAMMSGKTRAFVILPQNLEAIKKIFAVCDDEEIILFDSPDSLPKMINAMNSGRGKKIYFVLLPKFPFKILVNAGFVNGKDFLNGFDFLSEPNEPPSPNSYQLIQAL